MSARIFVLVLLSLAACAPAQTSASDDPTSSNASGDLTWFPAGSVDQAGVVEVTTIQLGALPTDYRLDLYNIEDPFAIGGGELYREAFTRRLDMFDAYDAQYDWSADQMAQWTTRISSGNYLVFDLSKPCDYYNPRTYLEIERMQMNGLDYDTCGGRMPNEDALDVTINFLIRGPAGEAVDLVAVHDGVDQATKTSSDTFPYLAELN